MRVTLAYPYTTPGGRTYKADSSPNLPDDVAWRLVTAGLARDYTPKTPAARRSNTTKEGA